MIFLTEKGRICVFKLSDFSQIMTDSFWDQTQVKSKSECKEHKLEFVNGCHLYAISKQLINKSSHFKIAAVCGRKIILIKYKCFNNNICVTCCNSFAQNATNNLVINPLIGLNNLSLGNQQNSNFTSSPNLSSSEFSEDIKSQFIIKKVILKNFVFNYAIVNSHIQV
jgi:hypothetical protein